MNALEYLEQLRPALPFSVERPCQVASKSEVRRWIKQGMVRINSEAFTEDELIDFHVFSLVFFPKSEKRKTTLI